MRFTRAVFKKFLRMTDDAWIGVALSLTASIILCGVTACEKFAPDKATLVALSMADPDPPPQPVPPPPPPRWTVDVVIDSASVAAAKPKIEETIAHIVDFIGVQDPSSQIRLWALNGSDAQLLDDKSLPQGDATRAVQTGQPPGRSAEATLNIQRLLAMVASAPRVGVSAIAEGITKVSLASPLDRGHWWIVLLSDGIETPEFCDEWDYYKRHCRLRLSCSPSTKAAWSKFLNDERLLPPGSLNGAVVTFAYFEPTPRPRWYRDRPCLSSIAFTQAIADLWRSALTERAGASRLTFALRAPEVPAQTSTAVAPTATTQEEK